MTERQFITIDEVLVKSSQAALPGFLAIPDEAVGIVLFAHGSGSSRFSARNRFVAESLNSAGLATLLFDLLTPAEQWTDEQTGHLRFDIDLLSTRLRDAIDWVHRANNTSRLNIGLFGASTGAAAALIAAADRPELVGAVVSRGGRPDLADSRLADVRSPTLFIVGANDQAVLKLNEQAAQQLRVEYRIEVVPHATHLFEEPGTLEIVSQAAKDWFSQYLVQSREEMKGRMTKDEGMTND